MTFGLGAGVMMITNELYYRMWELHQTGVVSLRLWLAFAEARFMQWLYEPETVDMFKRMKYDLKPDGTPR